MLYLRVKLTDRGLDIRVDENVIHSRMLSTGLDVTAPCRRIILQVLSDVFDLAFGWIELINSPKKLMGGFFHRQLFVCDGLENVSDSLSYAFHAIYFIRLTV